MDQTEQPDLFAVKLNASGKVYIRKFASVVRITIVCGIVISLLSITNGLIRSIKTDFSNLPKDKWLLIYYRTLPFSVVISSIFFLLQLHYYWKLRVYLKSGMEYNDEESFNNSFGALYRSSVFAMLTFVISVLMYALDFYLSVKYYLN